MILYPLEEVDDDLCGEFRSLLLLIFGSDCYLIDLCASRFFSGVYIFDNEQNGCAGYRYEAIPLSDVHGFLLSSLPVQGLHGCLISTTCLWFRH